MPALRGQKVLISGGSEGIGYALAQELLGRGAAIALLGRSEVKLRIAKEQLDSESRQVHTFACDVSNPPAVFEAISAATSALGGLDGLIANAGVCKPARFHEAPIEDIQTQVNTNFAGVLYTIRAGIPHLLRQGHGFIAITSSPAGNAGIPGFSVYGATKAALNNLSHTLRSEYADAGISVHLLLPPDTDTPGYAEETRHYPPELRAILSGGRLHQPDALAVRFANAIENGTRQSTAGFETHVLLRLVRYFPFLWEMYVRRKIRSVRKVSPSERT